MFRRIPILLFLVSCGIAPFGCLRAYNPTYFPNWGFGGDIVRTHAKPAGRAYFKNFDPFACRIDLTPGRVTNPINGQQVLIASVVDGEGKARRSRRVEWILDGPGYIVEVDESGLFAGRGYKVDNHYAVSYTDYREHTITRGNDDPADDFTINPGQTWCVVSCAVPGETVVTAYAPEIHDWRNGRITSRLTWSDTQFNFPPPVISRAGGEALLSTEVTRAGSGQPAEGLRVRYRILDGAPAVLASRSGVGTTAVLSGSNQKEAEVIAGSDGAAAVAVVQPTAAAGTTRIAVEVLKPDGTNAGTVVGRQETTVEWATSVLSLDVVPPKLAGVGLETPLEIVIANAGKADSQPVSVQAAVPEGAEFVRAEPAIAGQSGRSLTWTPFVVPGGSSRTITVYLKPTRVGAFTLAVVAGTPDRRTAKREGAFTVEKSELKMTLDVPKQSAIGTPVPVKITVNNPSAVPLERATAWVAFDAGLQAADGKNPVELAIGSVPAGGSKSVDVALTADKTGAFGIRANIVASGGLNDRAEATVAIRRSDMTVSVSGPEQVILGQTGTWDVVVVNTGETPLMGVSARATLPRSLTAKSTSTGNSLADVVTWTVGTLAPGERKTLRMTAVAEQTAEAGTITVAASSEGANGLRATGQTSVAVHGQPALTLQLVDPVREVPAGRRGTVKLTVRNRGNGPAKRVEVALTVTDELTLHGGRGPSGESPRVDGPTVTFPMVETIPPGGTVDFLVDVEATKSGSARLKAEARADHLTQPLRDEQPVRVVGGS
ncbi:MAG: DUF11 domain-containing protein [Bacteroidales bacterium]|nr:DUF11 domain-containing protein [Bacteroidales bacterium]